MNKCAETVPSHPDQFKRWADRECIAWPGDLQAKAYRAWVGLEKSNIADFEIFKDALAHWKARGE